MTARLFAIACWAGSVILAGSLQAGAATPAKSPSAVVKGFYTPEVIYDGDAKFRSLYADPAKRIYDLDEKLQQGGTEVGCIDFTPSVAAQDFDQGSIDKTLKLTETVTGDEARVAASFVLFTNDKSNRRHVDWWLKKVDGVWKVTDIASKEDDWRLSELFCGQDDKHKVAE